jgi:ABC-type sugar transport system permease subunit
MRKKHNIVSDGIAPYIFILPFVLSFLLFFVFPSAYAIALSFFRYKGYGTATFVGFQNYARILGYPHFWETVGNTLFYYVGHLVPVFALPFALALMLTSPKAKLKGFFQACLFIPNIVAVAAAALVFKLIFGRSGVINTLLGTSLPFLTDGRLLKLSVIGLMVWHSLGWFLVIFIAGLTTVKEELKEAAMLDGANYWQTIWHVVVPQMKPIFVFALLMDLISTLKLFVEPQLLLSTGTVGGNTVPPQGQTIISIMFVNLNNGAYGYAAAIGWVLFLFIAAASLLQIKLLKEGGAKE